jgi:hypothetical protein
MSTPRKIVQIAVDPTSIDGSTAPVIYALCSDGSLWRRWNRASKGWEQVPGIPCNEQEAEPC